MKNKKIYQYSTLKDSSLLYHKKVPAFNFLIVLLVLLFVAGAGVWGHYSIKYDVVELNGFFDVDDKTYVMPSINGIVKEVYHKEGDYVEEGEPLLSLRTEDIDNKIDYYNELLNELSIKKIYSTKLVEAIQNDTKKNPFKNNEEEKSYYNAFEDYLYNINTSIEDKIKDYRNELLSKYVSGLTQLNEQIQQYTYDKSIYESDLLNYSIKAGENGTITYSAHFVNGQIIAAGTEIAKIYNGTTLLKTIVSKVSGVVETINFRDGDSVLKDSIIIKLESNEINIKISQYTSNISNLKTKVIYYEKMIEALKNNSKINPFYNNSSQYEYYNEFENYLSKIVSFESNETSSYKRNIENEYLNNIGKIDLEIKQYESERKEYELSKTKYTITASSSGIISYNTNISKGMVVSVGNNIGTILNKTDELYLLTYASLSDRSKLELGEAVNVSLDGVSQNEFGTIKGEVFYISEYLISNESNPYFEVKIKLNKTSISSKNAKIDFSLGMGATARVIYKETSYLKWILEELGFVRK